MPRTRAPRSGPAGHPLSIPALKRLMERTDPAARTGDNPRFTVPDGQEHTALNHIFYAARGLLSARLKAAAAVPPLPPKDTP